MNTSNRMRIVIALIGALAIIIGAIIGAPYIWDDNESDGRKENISVRVADDNGDSVKDADILLFFPGGSTSSFTDSNGIAIFELTISEKVNTRLVVQTDQYEIFEREITLPDDDRIDVRLNSRPADSSSVLVRVVDNDNNVPVVGATVLLLVNGQVLQEASDSNGIAKFSLEFPENQISVEMSVATQDYELQYQNVTLQPNQVQDIRLNKISGEITVSPVTDSKAHQISTENSTSSVPDSEMITEQVSLTGNHPLGWPHEQNGMQLNLIKTEIRPGTGSQLAAARLWFAMLNKSPQRVLIELDKDQIYIEDSQGNRYVNNDGPGVESFWIDSGQVKVFDQYYTNVPGEKSRIPPDAFPILVRVDDLSRVQNASWEIGGEPQPTFKESNFTNSLGDAVQLNDFDVSVNDLEIRTTSDSSTAAFRAWFVVKNTSTTERKLLEVDFANLFIEDNFGNRYIDYAGAGLLSKWIESGQEYKFDRYYSLEYESRSRVPIGTSFVVIISEGIANNQRVEWFVDINR